MFKKIVIGVSVAGILATSGFASLPSDICQKHEAVNKSFNNENWCSESNSTKIQNSKEFQNLMIESDYSKSEKWGDIYFNMNEFLCYMKKNNGDTKEVRKFIVSNLKDGKWKSENLNFEDFCWKIIGNDKSIFKTLNQSDAGVNLVIGFADKTVLENNKMYSDFVSFVMKKDFKKAESYIKSINEKTGTNKAFKTLKDSCE